MHLLGMEYDEDGIYELEYQLNRSTLPMLIMRVGVLLLYFGVFHQLLP